MAKRNSTAKASSNSNAQPPKGMKPIIGGFAKTWNVEEMDTIHGKVEHAPKVVELTQGKKKVERRCIEVRNKDDERYTVWESAGLVPLFSALDEAKLPATVWIRFTGYGVAKKGQNAPKLFDAAIG